MSKEILRPVKASKALDKMSEPVAILIENELYLADEIDWQELANEGHKVVPLYTAQPVVPDGDQKCNVCQGNFTEGEGGRHGYLGILPVAFCPTCYTGLADMVDQSDCREWEGLTDEEISASSKGHMTRNGFARAIEAKLKEKNEL
jgi:hypothetical protein